MVAWKTLQCLPNYSVTEMFGKYMLAESVIAIDGFSKVVQEMSSENTWQT